MPIFYFVFNVIMYWQLYDITNSDIRAQVNYYPLP